MSRIQELTNELNHEVAQMRAREIEVGLVDATLKEREKRLQFLETREVAVAKREKATEGLRDELTLARTQKRAAIEREMALAKKLEFERREKAAALSELGRIRAAFPGLFAAPQVEAVQL